MQVSISTTTAVGILCLSDKYNVDSLKELCVGYMVDNSRSPKVCFHLNLFGIHVEEIMGHYMNFLSRYSDFPEL